MFDLLSFSVEIFDDLLLVVFVFSQIIFVCEKRKGFFVRLIVGFPIYALIGGMTNLLFAFGALYDNSGWLAAVRHFLVEWEWLVVFVAMIVYVWVCFRSNWNVLLIVSLAGLCTQQLMYAVWAFAIAVRPAWDTPVFKIVAFCLVGAGFAFLLYRYLTAQITQLNIKAIEKRSLTTLIPLYILSAVLVYCSSTSVIFLNMLFEPLQEAVGEFGSISGRLSASGARYASICTNAACNLMILFALRHTLRFTEKELEREVLEQIREQDRKQFTHFRNNVDYINTKSHDLKHYLDLIRMNKTVPQKELDEVAESILRLDSETDSGNETLDMILTDRRLVCAREGIELIFQTDGTRLEQLDAIDTFGIFCNVLDNAIRYVKELPTENRIIRLGIRTIRGMVFIHQENPFMGQLEMKDGLPVTTQSDETRHGFGLKSVQNTVKQRGGEFAVWAENGRFEIDICFPQGTIQE